MRMILRTLALLLVLAAPWPAHAERPEGLLWADTPLARTFPLILKTAAGHDYLVVLRDAATGRDVLGAYARGGAFFRVLVPPGRYELQFASGADWQGDAALFGPETRRFVLSPALAFGIEGVGKKSGQVVDLRDLGRIASRPVGICQRLALTSTGRQALQPFDAAPPSTRPKPVLPSFGAPQYALRSRICD